MPNLFNSIKLTRPGKSSFDLSHDVKLSCKFGQLVPTVCIDTIPGDKFTISCDLLGRLAPLASPIFHRIDMRMEYYFVPNRLVWPQWEQFITNDTGIALDQPLPSVPTITIDADTWTPLSDYFGIPAPPALPAQEVVNAMPYAAYQMIYNEYYRDQNLVDPVEFELNNGNNAAAHLRVLRNRAWEHDYFTSALPFAQKGAQVNLPIGTLGEIPVFRNTSAIGDPVTSVVATASVSPLDIPNLLTTNTDIGADTLYADQSTGVVQTTINDLRRATKLQEWLEKIARGGTRLTEVIRTFFGVKSSDQRLQRPEYIYGTKSPVIISEVLSTAETVDNPQANMAGHGVAVIKGNHGSFFCEEHGYIIGILSVMPKTAYSQGIPKHFTKYNNPYEWFWPQFEGIGEQAILNRELFAYNQPTGDLTFGYIPRYSEYKFMNNRVCGEFRESLAFWTMCRKFTTTPDLNQDFIEVDPDSENINNVFAVVDPAVEKIYAHILHKVRAIRPMSKFGNPSTF